MNVRRTVATISVSPKTKKNLESIKLADGDETWDHELERLFRIATAAKDRGILEELSA